MKCSLGGGAAPETSSNLEQNLPHLRRLEPDLRVGEAKGRQPCGRVDLVTATVSDLLRRRAVVPQSVGFHNQPEPWPEEVDAEAVHPYGSPGCRQAEVADQPKEDPLEFGVGEPERASVEDPAQRRNPACQRIPSSPERSVSGSMRSSLSASLIAASSGRGSSPVARSTSVLIGLVIGMPIRLCSSLGSSERRRWRRMP